MGIQTARNVFVLSPILIALSGGCMPEDPEGPAPAWTTAVTRALAQAGPPAEALEEQLLAQSCSGTVLVAEGKACVPHPQWQARRLFAEENRGAGRLDRYCVFSGKAKGCLDPTSTHTRMTRIRLYRTARR